MFRARKADGLDVMRAYLSNIFEPVSHSLQKALQDSLKNRPEDRAREHIGRKLQGSKIALENEISEIQSVTSKPSLPHQLEDSGKMLIMSPWEAFITCLITLQSEESSLSKC